MLDGDLERMQSLLRTSKRARDAAENPPPPPPTTPFDAVGEVEMTFRVLTDSGEEKERALIPAQRRLRRMRRGRVVLSINLAPTLTLALALDQDVYSLRPKDSEEEKWQMPTHMKCAACQASAHQGALALSRALSRRSPADPVGVSALEAMHSLCADHRLWTHEYCQLPLEHSSTETKPRR